MKHSKNQGQRTIVLCGGDGDGVGEGGFEGVVHGVHVDQPLDVAHLPEAPLVERRQRLSPPRLRHPQRPLPLQIARHNTSATTDGPTRARLTSTCIPVSRSELLGLATK